MTDKLEEVKDLEKKIVSREAEIEKIEDEIITEEKKIIKSQSQLSRITNFLTGFIHKLPAYNLNILRLRVVKRFNRHKVLYSFVTLVSIVLIWTGLQTFITRTPGISNPLIAIPAGLLIVWIIDRELA